MLRDEGHPSWYILLTLLPFQSFAAGTPGTLALFLSQECNRASIINPTVNLPVNTCLVTHGADGIAVKTLPPCATGIASFVIYEDTSCARKDDMDLQYDNCYFDGPRGLTAVGFECLEDGGGGGTTSTTTVSAGSSSLAVAAGTPEAVAPIGTTPQTTPVSNGASTTSVPNASSTASTPSPSATNSSGSSDGGNRSGSGLSQKWQIVLGVVVPVVAIVVALLAWWFPCHKGDM